MNDIRTVFDTMQIGFGFGVFAMLVYFATSRGDKSGFRLAPSNAAEWAGYWFRTLILSVTVGVVSYPSSHEFGGTLLAISTILLVTSSFAFWDSDRWFCVTGFAVSAVAVLWALLFPSVAQVRST